MARTVTMMTLGTRGLAVAAAFVVACAGGASAAPTSDPFANEPDAANGISIQRPAPAARSAPAPAPPQIGNPLWAVPVSALSATQDRPVFAPSRRPPPRAVAAAPIPMAPPSPPPMAAPPAPLQLSLIGAVVGEGDAIAVFLDRTTQGIVRMRAGQTHSGWALTSIQPREATLTRGAQTETVAIQRNDANQMQFPGGISPTGMPFAPNFAPFIPRATPRNGASDGL